MVWDESLLPEQRIAASHWGSSARVLAGPGTGKTKTLIHHIAYLLQEEELPPKQILVLTFTRAAAKELKERLINQLGLPSDQLPWVGTLHSYALKLLMEYPEQSDFRDGCRIADDYEENEIIFPEIGWLIGKTKKDVERAKDAYSARWNTLNENHPDWERVEFRREFETTLLKLGKVYNYKLRAELVYELWNMFIGYPLLGKQLNIKHVSVDEYQDLNACDQEVIAKLESFGANLFIVGDENQSIYSFRHANRIGIINFLDGRPNCGNYKIVTCYRCPQNVINLATSLIGWDIEHIRRELVPHPSAKEGKVVALQFYDHNEEAKAIADICSAYIRSGTLEAKDISILLSRKRLKRFIANELELAQIPFTDLVPMWPLGDDDDENVEGRLIYCKLRLLHSRYDSLALRTWFQLQEGIGAETINSIREYCLSNNCALWDGLLSISENPKQISRLGNQIKRNFDNLKSQLEYLESLDSLNEQLDKLINLWRSEFGFV